MVISRSVTFPKRSLSMTLTTLEESQVVGKVGISRVHKAYARDVLTSRTQAVLAMSWQAGTLERWLRMVLPETDGYPGIQLWSFQNTRSLKLLAEETM